MTVLPRSAWDTYEVFPDGKTKKKRLIKESIIARNAAMVIRKRRSPRGRGTTIPKRRIKQPANKRD